MAWALGPAPCTFRCLSQRFCSEEGASHSALGSPEPARRTWRHQGLLSQGGGPRRGSGASLPPSLPSFSLPPWGSRSFLAALWSCLQLEEVLPAARGRPSRLGGPFPGPGLQSMPGVSRVLLFHTCAPPRAHVVTAPHGAGRSFQGHPRLLSSSHGELVLMALVLS